MLADGSSKKGIVAQTMEISTTKVKTAGEASVKKEGTYSFAIHNWDCATNNIGESIGI
jgi:hypothetical protein